MNRISSRFPRRLPALGNLWMLVAGALFSIMGVCVKLGASHYSAAELVFYRSLFGLLMIWAFTLNQRLPLASTHLKLHISRSILGFFSLAFYFYAITHLPLATAITLNYTSPLFLAIFSSIMLREQSRPILVGAILLGFVGVTLLLNPTFHGGTLFAGVMGLLSGILAGFVYVQVTQLGRLGEPEWRTVFYFTLVCTLGAGLWMLVADFHRLRLADLPLLLALGASATLAQLAMTRAYRTGDPLVAGSLAYSTVVFASLFGILIWNEVLGLDEWLAIALIIGSGILSVQATNRTSRSK